MREHVARLAAAASSRSGGASAPRGPDYPRLQEGDEVSFQVVADRASAQRGPARGRGRSGAGDAPKLSAVRLWRLPRGTVSFADVIEQEAFGIVERVPVKGGGGDGRRGRPQQGSRQSDGSIRRIDGSAVAAETERLAATAAGDAAVVAAADATPESVVATLAGPGPTGGQTGVGWHADDYRYIYFLRILLTVVI